MCLNYKSELKPEKNFLAVGKERGPDQSTQISLNWAYGVRILGSSRSLVFAEQSIREEVCTLRELLLLCHGWEKFDDG